ncbi:MAG: MFS transporter [Shinella zoogloeoides]|uniref:MFS transporter n=1 Tax=Shinella zoogloeoides TaxID=352475 RepID=UPI003C77DB09
MAYEKQRLNYVLFLIAGAGLVNVARAMTLSFLAIKLQQTFGLGPAMIGMLLGIGPLVGAVVAPFAGSLSDKVGRKTVLTLTLLSMALAWSAWASPKPSSHSALPRWSRLLPSRSTSRYPAP